MSENILNRLLKRIYGNMNSMIGELLKEVILYGSYARGDYDDESDIDIALIVDTDRIGAEKLLRSLTDFTSNFCLENDVLVSFNCIPEKDFIYYKSAMPYYRNIDKEGVRLTEGEFLAKVDASIEHGKQGKYKDAEIVEKELIEKYDF